MKTTTRKTLPQSSPLPHMDLKTKSNLTLLPPLIGSLTMTKTTPHSVTRPRMRILTKNPSLQPHLCFPTRTKNILLKKKEMMRRGKRRNFLRKGKITLLLWVGGRFIGLAGGKIPRVPKHISRKHTSTIVSQLNYRQSPKRMRKTRLIRLEKYITTNLSEDTYVLHMSMQHATHERQPMRMLPVVPHDMLTSLLPDLIIFFQPERQTKNTRWTKSTRYTQSTR